MAANPQGEEPMPEAKPYNIPKQLVWDAYQRVKANRGAAGVDGESLEAFEKDLKGNLFKIWNRMSSGSYFPPPVRLVEIPKDNGGTRPLGIPTVGDRVAQKVVKMVLEPKVEPVFHPDSYGYRPGRSAIDAVAMARKRCWLGLRHQGLRSEIWRTLLARKVQAGEPDWVGPDVEGFARVARILDEREDGVRADALARARQAAVTGTARLHEASPLRFANVELVSDETAMPWAFAP
jgi:hypothetical protein